MAEDREELAGRKSASPEIIDRGVDGRPVDPRLIFLSSIVGTGLTIVSSLFFTYALIFTPVSAYVATALLLIVCDRSGAPYERRLRETVWIWMAPSLVVFGGITLYWFTKMLGPAQQIPDPVMSFVICGGYFLFLLAASSFARAKA